MLINNIKHFFNDRETRLAYIIHGTAAETGTVGLVTAPVPGDRFILGALQIQMIIEIAGEFGVSIDKSAAMALFESQIATVLGREMAGQATKYIPGPGNAVNGITAVSVTETIGWATADYYRKKN
ncbi:hypothetical protein LX73_0159 [Fodinibius salinus]|uniref:Uncharacterized protein n=2 Tax=Fodinibius salinus TaxID=860790 RepID=A0A5D3YPB2_9BACT|nr:hypothetical protein LX73_0159 [Fodinibius salinus]